MAFWNKKKKDESKRDGFDDAVDFAKSKGFAEVAKHAEKFGGKLDFSNLPQDLAYRKIRDLQFDMALAGMRDLGFEYKGKPLSEKTDDELDSLTQVWLRLAAVTMFFAVREHTARDVQGTPEENDGTAEKWATFWFIKESFYAIGSIMAAMIRPGREKPALDALANTFKALSEPAVDSAVDNIRGIAEPRSGPLH